MRLLWSFTVDDLFEWLSKVVLVIQGYGDDAVNNNTSQIWSINLMLSSFNTISVGHVRVDLNTNPNKTLVVPCKKKMELFCVDLCSAALASTTTNFFLFGVFCMQVVSITISMHTEQFLFPQMSFQFSKFWPILVCLKL